VKQYDVMQADGSIKELKQGAGIKRDQQNRSR
jgi:hypothetical protein